MDERKQTENPGQTYKKSYCDCILGSFHSFFSFGMFVARKTRSLSTASQSVHNQSEDDCVDDYNKREQQHMGEVKSVIYANKTTERKIMKNIQKTNGFVFSS